MEKLVALLRETSNLISRLNETLYFYVDIETKIPWLVILILFLLKKVIERYLVDGKLSSAELIKLLSGYLFILIAIAGSYANLEKIKESAHPEYTFFMVTAVAVGIVVIVAMLGAGDFKENANKKKLVIAALFTPIILLVLSNGSILQKRLSSLKAIVPRSNSTYIALPSEYDKLELGGLVPQEEINKALDTLNLYKAVKKSAIVGHQDDDKLIKPYAYIELEPNYPKSDKLKISIDDFFRAKAPDMGVSSYLYPHWIEFVDKMPTDSKGRPKFKILQRKAKNWSDLFYGNPSEGTI